MKVKHIGGDRDLQEFNEEFPKHGLAVVGFFAAWCGHCKTFKPEWEKFTKQAETSPLEGLVATIPEEHMKHAKCDRSDFQGFPTVRIFRKKGFEDYAGKREAGALMDHIKTLVLVSDMLDTHFWPEKRGLNVICKSNNINCVFCCRAINC